MNIEEELTKNLKIAESAREKLGEAARARYGTEQIRFSEVIETLSREEIARQRGGDE